MHLGPRFSLKNSLTVNWHFEPSPAAWTTSRTFPRAVEFQLLKTWRQKWYLCSWVAGLCIITFKRGTKSKWNTEKKQGSGSFATLQTQMFQWQTRPNIAGGGGLWLEAQKYSDRSIVKGKTWSCLEPWHICYQKMLREKKNAMKRRQKEEKGEGKILPRLIFNSILQLPNKQPST